MGIQNGNLLFLSGLIHKKVIGIRARADIERALAAKIFLGFHIKVSKEWQKDPKLLAKLGFGEKA